MNKDEIDLSAYPSYLRVRPGAAQEDGAEPRERVVRGLLAALVVGLVGVVLGVAVSRLMFMPEALSPFTGAVTSAAMVLGYTRAAGAAPRRGLLPLVVLLLVVLAWTFLGIVAGKAWWVYSLLEEDFQYLGLTRASFVWGVVAHPQLTGIIDDILFQLTMFTIVGSCLALWKVRRRKKG